MSQAPPAKTHRSAISGILFVRRVDCSRRREHCSRRLSQQRLPRFLPTGPTSPIRAGSFRMGACRGRTASTGPSVRGRMWSADPRTSCVLGVAQCTEVLARRARPIFYSLNGRASSGFSDLVGSIQAGTAGSFGFHLSATGGLGFPTGGSKYFEPRLRSLHSVPMVATIMNRRLVARTVCSRCHLVYEARRRNSIRRFEPTLSLERGIGPDARFVC